jgi:hypothetical protein
MVQILVTDGINSNLILGRFMTNKNSCLQMCKKRKRECFRACDSYK